MAPLVSFVHVMTPSEFKPVIGVRLDAETRNILAEDS
jgi:hypothetical protein